ncbi:hypothetical protein YC2023_033396 [Brassica napus]
MFSRAFRNGAIGDVVPHGSKVMRFSSLDSFWAEKKIKKIKRGETRGLPGRSPILVLLSPKHASLRSSDGIRCISAGMIAPVSTSLSFLYILFSANPSARPWGPHDFLAILIRAKKCVEINGAAKKNKKIKRSPTRGLPGRSPILVLLSPKHASLRSSDGIWCISAGMIAPVSTSLSFLYILFSANPSARPWGPHDFLAVLFRARKCVEVNGVKKASKTP